MMYSFCDDFTALEWRLQADGQQGLIIIQGEGG